jgi:hypothetical protein
VNPPIQLEKKGQINVCRYACQLKVEHRDPCDECLAEWAELTRSTEQFARECRQAQRFEAIQRATDEERRAFLDQVAPVVPHVRSKPFVDFCSAETV